MSERIFLIVGCLFMMVYCIFIENAGAGATGWLLLTLLVADDKIRTGGHP